MNPYKIVEDPPRCRVLHGFALLIRKPCLRCLERLCESVLQSRINQETSRQHPEQWHNSLRLFEVKRRSEKPLVFQKTKSAFRTALAFVAGQQLLRRELGGVKF